MLRRALLFIFAMGPAALPAPSLAADTKPKRRHSVYRQAATGHPRRLHRCNGRVRPRGLRGALQGQRRCQGRHPATETRRWRQLRLGREFQPARRPQADRRTAFGQLHRTGERQPRLFHRPQSDFLTRPAAGQSRHDQGDHGQIRRAHHRRRPAPLLHLPRGLGDFVGTKYKEATALDAIDKPLDPRAAVKLNGDTVRGSCVAVVKRAQAKAKTLSAMFDEAKGANCDGVLSVQLIPGNSADRVGIAQFTLLDTKLVVSATAIDNEAAAGHSDQAIPRAARRSSDAFPRRLARRSAMPETLKYHGPRELSRRHSL